MSLVFRAETVGTHVHVRVFANGALTGTLVMRPEEARELRARAEAPLPDLWEWLTPEWMAAQVKP